MENGKIAYEKYRELIIRLTGARSSFPKYQFLNERVKEIWEEVANEVLMKGSTG